MQLQKSARDEFHVTSQKYDQPSLVLTELESRWRMLSNESTPHFFLSWDWISRWLSIVSGPLLFLEVSHKGDCVGMGLVAQRRVRKWRLFSTQQYWLHRSGDPLEDQAWIEYNDCLLRPDVADAARAAIYSHLFEHCAADEVYVGLSLPAVVLPYVGDQIALRTLLTSRGFNKSIGNHTLDTLLQTFSSNTRKQIKRSLKLLAEQGDVVVRTPQSQQERLQWSLSIAQLHREKWQETTWGSGFDNPAFVRFHQPLMEEEGYRTELLALMVNHQPRAYLYNLIDGESVYFYLSAIPDVVDNRMKLGLVTHTLAMAYYSEQGKTSYDFLAGESRYKRSLAQNSYEMGLYCLYRPRWQSRLEDGLRCLKQRLQRATPKPLT